jgi:hypothetical protein
MQRKVLGAIGILILALAFAAPGAGAETQWVGSEQLVADPSDPAVVSFTVDVREPGSYQVRLLARGEAKRQIELQLTLRPEDGGEERTVRFSFTGAGCG